MIEIREADVAGDDALKLLAELNETLAGITGASGAASFNADDISHARAVFLIAYGNGTVAGCGALRPLSETRAEIKRVYARPNSLGVGSAIVKALEEKARTLGYTELVLETRKVNAAAVSFYQKSGYRVCENFGKYKGREDAVCLSKTI